MAVSASQRLFTIDEYHHMVEAAILREDDRVELLAGVVVEMTPIDSRHAGCVSRLNRLLGRLLGDGFIVRVQDPLQLDDYSEPQPDIAIVGARGDFYRDRHPRPGDALLVIEVADTSADVDRADKVPLYARCGIPEVWVVDLAGAKVHAYRGPVKDGYLQHEASDQSGVVVASALSNVQIRVRDLIG